MQLVRPKTGEIVDVHEPADLPILDTYAPEPVAAEEPRLDCLATISAGYKKPGQDGHAGTPVVSRDGTIYCHDPKGRAPGLKRALEATKGMRLTVAFPFNNPSAFVQQRFTEYSSTHLLAYGDEYSITTIDPKNGARHVFEAGTDEYDAARRRCKVATSIYFALAEWTGQGPRVVWPDGLGLYRLRTTSRNSLRNLRAAIGHVSRFTGGQVAGIPFDLALDYRDVAGPDGSRRNVPVWTFTMAPPEPLTSRTFAPTLRDALHEGQLLQIAPPAAESEEVAEGDYREMGDDDEAGPGIAEEELALVQGGGRCDAAHYERVFFAMVRGTQFESDEARRELVADYWDRGDSLAQFLAGCTEEAASRFIAHVAELIAADVHAERRERLAPHLGGTAEVAQPADDTAQAAAAAFVKDDMARLGMNGTEYINSLQDDGEFETRPAQPPLAPQIDGPFFDRPMTEADIAAPEATAPLQEDDERRYALALAEYSDRMREARELGLNVKAWTLPNGASLDSLQDTTMVVADAIAEKRARP